MCAGVVKAPKVHEKNPVQHFADLEMLEVLKPVFFNMTNGRRKEIDFITVDRASDEGPGHEEVQFWWTY